MHHEHHLKSSDTIRDIVIGMSDGLTVPFALAAGLSGAVNSSGIVVTAGIAEIVENLRMIRRDVERVAVPQRRLLVAAYGMERETQI